ncbi:radical SAM protein [Bradyrhizobium sp. RT4b]|uniref:radical SAM protein n=1 Tax=Bradyrhizobium sp. RT4b TaxID=3156379 RepID=UPI003396A5AC
MSVDEMTNFIDLLIDRYGLTKVSVTGGEPLLRVVFPRTEAVLAHGQKRGMQVQLNTAGLGQVPISDVVSIFDDPGKLTLQFSFDGAKRDTVDRFRGKLGVYDSALRRMSEAANSGVLVQARMTANRQNIAEALDAFRLLSSIGVGSFRIKPMFASGAALDNEEALLGSADEIRELQQALIATAAKTSARHVSIGAEANPDDEVVPSGTEPEAKYEITLAATKRKREHMERTRVQLQVVSFRRRRVPKRCETTRGEIGAGANGTSFVRGPDASGPHLSVPVGP